MAKILSKAGIITGNALESSFVTQSIDAFIGGEAYDIYLSGSFNMTGSTFITGSLTVGVKPGFTGITNLAQPTTINGNVTLNNTTITGSLLLTGSISTVGNLTTVGSIIGTNTTSANFISGSIVIGSKNGITQDNSGGAVSITMTTTTYPPDSIISITQTTLNNAVAFTLPEPEIGLEYTFLANLTSTGTGTTTFNTPAALIDGVFICSDSNINLNGKETIGFNQTKFIKGTRVHFISGRTNWNFTAYSLCESGDINYNL
jgi:hypothetical protein